MVSRIILAIIRLKKSYENITLFKSSLGIKVAEVLVLLCGILQSLISLAEIPKSDIHFVPSKAAL